MMPSEELARFLDAQGVATLGADSGWAVFFSQMPKSPDSAISLHDGGGSEPVLYDEQIRAPFVEVRVRGTDYAAVSDKAQEIFDLLCQTDENPPAGRTIEGGHYIGIWLASDFIDLGRDEHDRFRISSNYRCNRQSLEAIS